MLNGTFDWKWLADRIKDPLTYFDVLIDALATRSVKDFAPKTRDMMTANSGAGDSPSRRQAREGRRHGGGAREY